jgi:tetratricopeptide (TPR) repeat protein
MIMMTPLAQTRRRRHFMFMNKYLRFYSLAVLTGLIALASPAWAQTAEPEEDPPQSREAPVKPDLGLPNPQNPEPIPDENDVPAAPEIVVPAEKPELKTEAKDLTVHSEADRQVKLDELFNTLQEQILEADAELVAEEIWAVFLQSRSATVDFMLLRGIAAHKNGDLGLARRMFDHVTRLQPGYAEGWSRSGRLAVDEKDLNRAANDVARSLVIEPRHFYALWTLGNILETLGRRDAAFEAYAEAAKLYPLHKQINERLEYLRADVEGQTL